ncbi:MAG TPA: MXAN_5187 C-terminal domain-containing protein [Myxococcota bacterium]|nr:MXAN_5187 C-terminal domain-containing protein [Myxococcota bacterium]
MAAEAIDEELRMLEFKLAQLKRDYDQYFLGNRPREPVQLRGEINKAVIELTNTAIKNTASRFKFSSICSRYQAFRRQWDETLRKIEAGTYERHRFKARLHQEAPAADAAKPPCAAEGDLFQSYVDARISCGESVKGLTREKLDAILAQQRAALCAKYGPDSQFRFRVQIEDGKPRLKASRVKS